MQHIAIFGGTFDPIHSGHLNISLSLQQEFRFDSFLFLPCKKPVLKATPHASNEQRIDMIKLAIKNHPEFTIDLREIERNTPSYMVDTLESFRLDYPEDSITLIMGYDAFLSLPDWHQWEKLITLAHLLIINRNEFAKAIWPPELDTFLKSHLAQDKTALQKQPCGSVFFFNAGNYEISSTALRNAIKDKKNVRHKLPDEVYQYIQQNQLYQSDQ